VGVLSFDGHNDTLLRMYKDRIGADGFLAGDERLSIDLPRAREGGLAAGIFAIFTPSPEEANASWNSRYAASVDRDRAAPLTRRVIALAEAIAAASDGAVTIVHDLAELDAAHARGGLGVVLHIEGAEAVDPGLEDLDAWYAAGLRSVGPVWSRENAFAHGVPFRFPSTPDHGPGLTPAGRRLVERCNELGMLVDLSHINEAGFWDVARVSRAPLIASHSNAHALAQASRNLTDAQLEAIATSSGIVGLNYAAPFVRADGADDADTPVAELARHAGYIAERIGVEHIGLGSDYDGATMPLELSDVSRLPVLEAALRDEGFTPEEIELIAWDNWRRVLAATWR
jgi:membrane dipeptidase